MSANYELRGDVAVITMDNPPVNGLGYDTRRGIVDGLDKALADPKVKAIVVTGAGKAFSGGADIREFGSPKAIAEPNLLSLIAAFEASPSRSSPRSTASPWAAASSSRSAATSAFRCPACRSRCRK